PLLPRPLPPSPLVLLLHPVPHPLDALESLLACRRVGRVAPGLRRARRSGAGAGLAIPPRVGRRDVHLLLDLRREARTLHGARHAGGALLTADALLVLLAQCSAVPRWWTAGAAVVATAAASAGVALVIHPRVADVDLPRLLGVVLVAITAASAIAWWRLGRVRAPALRRVGVMVAAIFAVELWMFQLVYPSIDGEQSAQGIARAAAARVPPGGSVGALSRAPLAAALRYYGGKPVEEIESADSMRSFLARGGRVVRGEA